MAVHTYNLSTQEAGVEGSLGVQSQPCLQSELQASCASVGVYHVTSSTHTLHIQAYTLAHTTQTTSFQKWCV